MNEEQQEAKRTVTLPSEVFAKKLADPFHECCTETKTQISILFGAVSLPGDNGVSSFQVVGAGDIDALRETPDLVKGIELGSQMIIQLNIFAGSMGARFSLPTDTIQDLMSKAAQEGMRRLGDPMSGAPFHKTLDEKGVHIVEE